MISELLERIAVGSAGASADCDRDWEDGVVGGGGGGGGGGAGWAGVDEESVIADVLPFSV